MATPNAAGGRGGGRPCLRTRRDLFGAVLRTHVEPQDQSVPTATQVPVHRGKGSERAFPPPLPPSRKWFAPDILIGSSLPFERRAAQVARRPFNFGSEGERGGSVSRPAPPLHAGRLSPDPELLSLGLQVEEALFRVPGLVPSPFLATNSLYEPGQVPFPLCSPNSTINE